MQSVDNMDIGISSEIAENLEAIKEAKKQGQNVEYAVKVLADYIFSSGKTGPDLNDIARSLLANPPDTKEGESVATKLTPDTLITSDFLIDKISHWVELVRNEIVGLSQAPFSTIKEAAMWIEQGAPQEGEMMREQLMKREQALKRGEGFTMYFRTMTYVGENGARRRVHIVGPKPQEWSMPQMRGHAGRYSELNWLESETRIMESVTGFSQLSLIHFVLVGIKPILRRFTTSAHLLHFTLPDKEELRPTRVEIDIRARDLSFQELHEIYTQYRTYLQLQRGKAFNEKHLALYRLVKRKGIPPKGKGIVAFWNSVRDEWNSLYPNDKHQSWKGVKQNYERVIQKLKDRFESNKLGVVPQKEAQNERSHSQEVQE